LANTLDACATMIALPGKYFTLSEMPLCHFSRSFAVCQLLPFTADAMLKMLSLSFTAEVAPHAALILSRDVYGASSISAHELAISDAGRDARAAPRPLLRLSIRHAACRQRELSAAGFMPLPLAHAPATPLRSKAAPDISVSACRLCSSLIRQSRLY